MRCRLSVILLVLAWMPTGVASATMLVQSYDETKHDRFYDDVGKAFIGEPHDWSGVARGNRWATMVSSNYFISATHYHPADGNTLRFYYSNDPDGYETRTVASGVQIGETDLWLGRLSAPVSSQVTTYPVLSLPEWSDYDNRVLYVFGLSDKSPTQENVRLGRNNIDPDSYVLVTDEYDREGVAYTFDYDTSDDGLGDDECYLQLYDSGGPSFSIIDGAPALVGIHWFIYTDPETGVKYSGDSFVPYYVDEINAEMSGEQLTLIPEPSTWAMLIAAAVACLLYARRSGTRVAPLACL